MSTLNSFGFNVRRKRNHDTAGGMNSQSDKSSLSTDTSSLAFAAASPQSINTHIKPAKMLASPISKKSTSTTIKSKPNKRHSTKDPKQSTLLPFFATQTTPATNTTVAQSQEKDQIPLMHQQQEQKPPGTTLVSSTPSYQGNHLEEENKLCLVRRSIDAVDLLLILEEAFDRNLCGNVDIDQDTIACDEHQKLSRRNRPNTPPLLLQVKPSRVIYLPPPFEMMDRDNNNSNEIDKSVVSIGHRSNQRRQRSQEHEKVKNKRLCPTSCNGAQRHIYSFMDEFDIQQQQDDIEIMAVRHCLSPEQMVSRLLGIANEMMAFENNNWCTSYLDQRSD
ncbi:hypothetical protein BCR42DRAFT_451827 [Absidia repens]|uniref:Uncharacterized protein n=1 Tax=Absidia repens TaxID=90262 RepID=A0A1X2IGH4_9FUNG|nr:hypothetical protein BCR42DRAFT_451827 [Absidia repens]